MSEFMMEDARKMFFFFLVAEIEMCLLFQFITHTKREINQLKVLNFSSYICRKKDWLVPLRSITNSLALLGFI